MPSNFTSDDNTRISTIENKVSNLQQAFATIDSGEQSELQSFLNETNQKFVYSGFMIQKISGTMRLGVAKNSDSDSIAYVNGNRVRSDDKTTANNFAVQIPSTDSSGYQRHLIVLNTAGLIVALSSAVNADYDYATAEADGMLVLAELHVPASTVLNLDSVGVTLTDKRRFYAMAERLPSYYVPGRLFMLTATHGSYSAGLYAYNGSTWNYVAPPTGGVIPVSQGGTGAASFASGNVLIGNGTSPIVASNLRVVGQVLSHTDGTSCIMSGTATNYVFYTPNVTNLRFQVGAYPQVTITNDGKLGVGANLIPSYPLHVRLENNLLMGFTGSGGIAYMRAFNSAGTGSAPLYIVGQSIGIGANSTYGIALMSNGDIKLGSNDSLFLNYANNRAGMGTQNPLGKFDSRSTALSQLVASYNDSVFTGLRTLSTGAFMIAPTGASIHNTFNVSDLGINYVHNQMANSRGAATIYRTLFVDRGQIGATHTGSGSDSFFSGEAADFLGIRGENGIQFGVAAAKLLHLSKSGTTPRFGINQFNPQHYLDISARGNGSGYGINIDSTTRTPSDVVFNITGNTGTSIFNVQAGGITNASSLNLTSNLSVAGNLTVDTNTFVVNAANNKVGIGTASPQTPLHVKGYGEIVWIETTNPIGSNFIRFRNPSGNMGYIGYGSSGNNSFTISNELNGDMGFLIDGSVKMTLKVDGKLGLGTVAPQAPLHVAGMIRAVAGDTSTIFVSNNTSAGGSDQFRIKNNFAAVDIENLRGSLDLYPNGSGVARFTNTGLAIGGLFNPGTPLDIRTSQPTLRLRDTSAAGSAAYTILAFEDNTGSNIGYVGYGSSSTPHLHIYNSLNGDIFFSTNNKSMVFDSSGNFGVGIASSIAARIHSVATTEQLRLGYDGSLFWGFGVNNGGQLNLLPAVNGAYLRLNTSSIYSDYGYRFIDDRDIKPNELPGGTLSLYFHSQGGMTGTADSGYLDAIFLNSWTDSSAGSVNAITFSKTVGKRVQLWQAAQTDTSWGTPVTFAFTDLSGQVFTTKQIIRSADGSGQLRLSYDVSNNVDIGCDATGDFFLQTTGNNNFIIKNGSRISSVRMPAIGALLFHSSLSISTNSEYTTAFGVFSLHSLTTGAANAAFGYEALRLNSSGAVNAAFGHQALRSNTTGNSNTALGDTALYTNSSGSKNTGIGRSALFYITTGENNTALGYDAQASSATVSNEITLGDANVTSLRCNVTSISSLSDARDKTNFRPIRNALNLVDELSPLIFDWDRRDGTFKGRRDSGFTAQALKEFVLVNEIDWLPGLVYEENPDRMEAAYSKLLPLLVAAIKEMHSLIKEVRS